MADKNENEHYPNVFVFAFGQIDPSGGDKAGFEPATSGGFTGALPLSLPAGPRGIGWRPRVERGPPEKAGVVCLCRRATPQHPLRNLAQRLSCAVASCPTTARQKINLRQKTYTPRVWPMLQGNYSLSASEKESECPPPLSRINAKNGTVRNRALPPPGQRASVRHSEIGCRGGNRTRGTRLMRPLRYHFSTLQQKDLGALLPPKVVGAGFPIPKIYNTFWG